MADPGTGLALRHAVALRKRLVRTLMGVLIMFTALVSVGLTAPADGPFSIVITPVFLRLDQIAVARSDARVIGLDIDVKIGSTHLHYGWSAVPISSLTTNATSGLL
jgi:hypothetical protein